MLSKIDNGSGNGNANTMLTLLRSDSTSTESMSWLSIRIVPVFLYDGVRSFRRFNDCSNDDFPELAGPIMVNISF